MHAGIEDGHIVAEIVAEAFQHIAVAHWLVPSDADRRRVLRDTMLIWSDEALHGWGCVDITTDLQAVAVWFMIGAWSEPAPPRLPENYDTRLAAACGRYTPRFRLLDQTLDQHHPYMRRHHRLAFLAVVPKYQGQGRGAALLTKHHNEFPNTPTYLEASSPQSRELYLRHGYRDLGGHFDLPESGPSIWPMWRSTGP
jgi:GNAT superfamily N-acetyltransferase